MKVVWLAQAERSFDRQLDHIAIDNPSAALSQGDAIMAAVQRLGAFPRSGRQGRVEGTRELVVAGTPFIVAYRIRKADVAILRVMHGAQRWPRRF